MYKSKPNVLVGGKNEVEVPKINETDTKAFFRLGVSNHTYRNNQYEYFTGCRHTTLPIHRNTTRLKAELERNKAELHNQHDPIE